MPGGRVPRPPVDRPGRTNADAPAITDDDPGRTSTHRPHVVRSLEGRILAGSRPTSINPRTTDSGPYGQQSDRKSTRLNSSHANISYAVFCLKKNKNFHTTS